jgi:hypothetical protein
MLCCERMEYVRCSCLRQSRVFAQQAVWLPFCNNSTTLYTDCHRACDNHTMHTANAWINEALSEPRQRCKLVEESVQSGSVPKQSRHPPVGPTLVTDLPVSPWLMWLPLAEHPEYSHDVRA